MYSHLVDYFPEFDGNFLKTLIHPSSPVSSFEWKRETPSGKDVDYNFQLIIEHL